MKVRQAQQHDRCGIKIRHLQCFLVTARLRHVGRAADRLCVTQPALDLAAGTLVELPVNPDGTAGPVGMTTRADESGSAITLAFMGAIRRVAERRVRGRGRDQ